MSWDIVFDPFLAWPLTAALVFAGVAVIAITIFTRARGWPLRTLALGAFTLALLNPSFRNEERENLGDIAVAVVDQSRSQDFGNRHAQTEAALAALKSAAARLGNIELKVVTAHSGIVAGEDGTRLF